MQEAIKSIARGVLIALWVFFGIVIIYQKWHDKVFQDGYERGAWHTVIYHSQRGKYPPAAWRDAARRFVGAKNEEWWIRSVEASYMKFRWNNKPQEAPEWFGPAKGEK